MVTICVLQETPVCLKPKAGGCRRNVLPIVNSRVRIPSAVTITTALLAQSSIFTKFHLCVHDVLTNRRMSALRARSHAPEVLRAALSSEQREGLLQAVPVVFRTVWQWQIQTVQRVLYHHPSTTLRIVRHVARKMTQTV